MINIYGVRSFSLSRLFRAACRVGGVFGYFLLFYCVGEVIVTLRLEKCAMERMFAAEIFSRRFLVNDVSSWRPIVG